MTIRWLDGADEIADIPAGSFEGVIAEAVDATHDIKIVRVKIRNRSQFDFRAGQYVRLLYPGSPPRDYSIASCPDADLIEFHVRHVAGGATSARIFARATAGDTITIEGPFGSSFLRERHRGPILGIAGGSGLAPVKAVSETALARNMGQPIHVYFGARASRDLYMIEHFRELTLRHGNLSFVPVLSEETQSGRRSGHVGAVVAADFSDLDGWKAYLAGPPAMIDATMPLLIERGIRAADIHADVFFTPER